MSDIPTTDLANRLGDFVRYRRNHLTGDEKGEAQVFIGRLFKAFGHQGVLEAGAKLEKRVKRRAGGNVSFADLVWRPRVLLEMKKAGEPPYGVLYGVKDLLRVRICDWCRRPLNESSRRDARYHEDCRGQARREAQK